MLLAVFSRARTKSLVLVSIVVASMFQAMPATAAPAARPADPDLSTSVDYSGTGALVTKVRTPELKAAAPSSGAARILVIGTGVQRSLFPTDLQGLIAGVNGVNDLTDGHGYGTIAVSTILQLLPNVTISSYKVGSHNAGWDLARMNELAAALEHAQANRSRYDAVLLAFPPQAALDPVSHVIGHVDRGKFGKGMALVVEAMLSTRQLGGAPALGIPESRSLRDAVFARANLTQRDAVEAFANQALAYRKVVRLLATLNEAGVGVVAPSGDYTRKSGSTVVPLPTQTVFGLSALPSVITVGASYLEGSQNRISPTSGRGPTLGLVQKPDLLAPSDVLALLPDKASLPWKDDSARAPLEMLRWARPGSTPTSCPSLTGVYRCVLQGSSMVSASVVTANIAATVASNLPNAASSRSSIDDEALRGMAWAQASAVHSKPSNDERASYSWEEGAGVFTGMKSFNISETPVALQTATFGEIPAKSGASRQITFWSRSAQPTTATPKITGFLGPDASGQAVALPASDGGRLGAGVKSMAVELTAAAGRHQGGFYGGRLTLTGPTGSASSIPFSYTQDVALDFHVDYAYNEFQTGGLEGERVEDASVVLFPGLPTNVGLIGEAFKNLTGMMVKNFGGDLLSGMMIRAGTTKNSFTDAAVPASEHGRGRIDAVPPGFYRIHLISDHSIEGQQPRGRVESVGIGLASSGPEAAVVPGSNLLVPSQPVCGENETGPMDGCVGRGVDSEVDPGTGMCVARNGSTSVAFNYYCGEMSYAVPTAIVSRAVHMIQNNADPTKSEWATCGVNVPLDGSGVDLAKVTGQAKSCQGPTTPSSWSFNTKAPDCLSPKERAANPSGHPDDMVASYSGLNTASLRNLPVAVMTYKFKLPELNTYTTAGLSLSYAVENALVAVRFQTGDDNGDASHGLLVVDDPRVKVTPALNAAGKKGSSYNEWAVMSSNATVGTVSLIVIPTAWTRADLDPTKPIARVQLCDVALKVNTFAKTSWGMAALEGGVPTQFTKMLDRDLLGQIRPNVDRVRPLWNGTAFTDGGVENEDLTFATQIPKNTTRSTAAPHHVLSPRGGPAYFKTARRYDGVRGDDLLGGTFKTYDPGYGINSMACAVGREDPPSANFDKSYPTGDKLCRLWQTAKANGELLAEVAHETKVNGRFSGLLSLDHATLTKAGGDVAYEIADADDAGAFDAAKHWVVSNGSYVKRLPISTFYDELSPLSLNLLSGVLAVVKDAAGNYVLRITGGGAGGATHTVSATLG